MNESCADQAVLTSGQDGITVSFAGPDGQHVVIRLAPVIARVLRDKLDAALQQQAEASRHGVGQDG